MASKIDIDGLTEAELIDLNNRIVERLRFLHQARAHSRAEEGQRCRGHLRWSERR